MAFHNNLCLSLNERHQTVLWYAIKELSYNIREPWVIVKDFNDITTLKDQFGGFTAYV